MKSGSRNATPSTIVRWTRSTPCCARINVRFTPVSAPSGTASAGCTTSNARSSPPPLIQKESGGPKPAACRFHLVRSALPRNLSLLRATRADVFLFEPVDAAGGVHQLLAAREERVAGRADFHADIAFVRRASLEDVPASANHVQLIVSGVNASLHYRGFLSRFP